MVSKSEQKIVSFWDRKCGSDLDGKSLELVNRKFKIVRFGKNDDLGEMKLVQTGGAKDKGESLHCRIEGGETK